MTIELNKGCTVTGISVNNTLYSELNTKEQDVFRHFVCNLLYQNKDDIDIFDLTEFLLEKHPNATYTFSQPCECCGDCIETYKLDI